MVDEMFFYRSFFVALAVDLLLAMLTPSMWPGLFIQMVWVDVWNISFYLLVCFSPLFCCYRCSFVTCWQRTQPSQCDKSQQRPRDACFVFVIQKVYDLFLTHSLQ